MENKVRNLVITVIVLAIFLLGSLYWNLVNTRNSNKTESIAQDAKTQASKAKKSSEQIAKDFKAITDSTGTFAKIAKDFAKGAAELTAVVKFDKEWPQKKDSVLNKVAKLERTVFCLKKLVLGTDTKDTTKAGGTDLRKEVTALKVTVAKQENKIVELENTQQSQSNELTNLQQQIAAARAYADSLSAAKKDIPKNLKKR